ncbi:hypothetical protein IT402_00375 [Candidatus Nomurabacteria bacterium]|nr:hypothetical protein [Candidatus Nomurabacteria bacterium]
MDIKNSTYENVNEIYSFAGSGNLCFCDDYKYNKRLYNIVYPSVRHTVLSWKTDDLDIKKRISETLLPANLKELENSIRLTSSLWKWGFIKNFFEEYTLKKFSENPEFAKKLLATYPKKIIGGLLPGQANFMINELQDIPGYEGKVLMQVRDNLRKQKVLI